MHLIIFVMHFPVYALQVHYLSYFTVSKMFFYFELSVLVLRDDAFNVATFKYLIQGNGSI